MGLDRTHLRLLDLLQSDGRMSITDLAQSVNRAESTVRERIDALEQRGILRGFRAVVDMRKLGFTTQAFVRADCKPGAAHQIAKALETIPNITRVTLTTGPKRIWLEVWAADLQALEHLLEQRIAPMGLEQIETRLVVDRLVDERPFMFTAEQPPSAAPVESSIMTPP